MATKVDMASVVEVAVLLGFRRLLHGLEFFRLHAGGLPRTSCGKFALGIFREFLRKNVFLVPPWVPWVFFRVPRFLGPQVTEFGFSCEAESLMVAFFCASAILSERAFERFFLS